MKIVLKLVIIIAIALVFLFMPLNVNAISVDEFENLLQEVQTEDDIDILISHLFKNTDYLKTCKDLDVEIKADYGTDSYDWEQSYENNNKFVMLDCPGQKVYWDDAPEQYSQSKCNELISDLIEHNKIYVNLSHEYFVIDEQERQDNAQYLEETGIQRQGDEADKWFEKEGGKEEKTLINSLVRDYRQYCPKISDDECNQMNYDEGQLAILENPSFDEQIQEKIINAHRDSLCLYTSPLEAWVEKRLDMGLPISVTLSEVQLQSSVNSESKIELEFMSDPICGAGTLEQDGICVIATHQQLESAPTSKGGGCLIATATYGSELAPQVQQLREIRDNSLLTTTSGIQFMSTFNDIYYSFSPVIADYERENPLFKEMVKVAITPMVSSLSILNYVDMDSEESVLGYGISLILLNVGMYFVAPAIAIVKLKQKL